MASLLVTDQLAFLAAAAASTAFLPLVAPESARIQAIPLLTFLSPAAFLVAATLGLYRLRWLEPGIELRRVTLGTSLLFGVALLASLGNGSSPGWAVGLVATYLFSLVLVPWARTLVRHLWTRLPGSVERVLILGDDEEGRSISSWLSRRSELALVPVGPLKGDCSLEKLESVARSESAAHLVVTPSAQGNAELTRRLQEGMLGFEYVTLVPSVASLTPMTATRHVLGSTWGISLRPPVDELPSRWIKRGVDLALGVPLFFLSVPALAVLAVCVKLVSPGPALFRQRRVGFGGAEFDLFKLRSMHPDAEERLQRHLSEIEEARHEWERGFKLKNDPRLLPMIGSFLRRTSLDELPQLFNVVRGEMSLVGPRPLPRYHATTLPEEFHRSRARVVPGLTGLWQISARGDGEALVELDLYYLRNWSIWLDLRILAATCWAVIVGRGAH